MESYIGSDIERELKWTDAIMQALGENKAKNYWKVCGFY